MNSTLPDVPVQSVRKALDLLAILAFEDRRREGITLSDLARATGMKANTTHNLLRSMVPSGFVAQTADSRYVAGPRCLQIGLTNRLTSAPESSEVRALLEAASARLEEAVVLAILVQGKRLRICAIDPAQAIRVDQEAIPDQSIYDTPTGRILTAFASPHGLAEILRQWGLPCERWDGLADEAALAAALAEVRRVGSITIAPDPSGLAAISCPILDDAGPLLGALGCYAPMFRCPAPKRAQILAELHKTAKLLSEHMRLSS